MMSNSKQFEIADLADAIDGIKARLRSLEASAGSERGPTFSEVKALADKLNSFANDQRMTHAALNEIQETLRSLKAAKQLPTAQLIEVIGGPIAEKINEINERGERNLKHLRSEMGSIVSDAERAAKAGATAAEKSVTDFAAEFAFN